MRRQLPTSLERQAELKAAGEWSYSVCYLGGHPESPGTGEGQLALRDGALWFAGTGDTPPEGLLRRVQLQEHDFSIALTDVREVHGLSGDELTRPPGHFVGVAGFAIGFDKRRRHPLNGRHKLFHLLTIEFLDPYGDSHIVGFANVPGVYGDMRKFPRVDVITAARHSARNGRSDPARAASPTIPDQVRELGVLHAQGVLTADEFKAAKAKLLGPASTD